MANGHTQILEDFTIIQSGGHAGRGFNVSEITIRRFKNYEELRIGLGDAFGKPYSGQVSYHRLTWNPKSNRGQIFLSQIFGSKFKESKVASLVGRSQYLKKLDLFFDPFDQTQQLRFELKPGTRVVLNSKDARQSFSQIILQLRGETSK